MNLVSVAEKRRAGVLEFFQHEPYNIARCFTDLKGTLNINPAQKAQLLGLFRTYTGAIVSQPTVKAGLPMCLIIDLSFVVNLMADRPFVSYDACYEAVWAHIKSLSKNYDRVDIVSDNYHVTNQLKDITHKKRGSGTQIAAFHGRATPPQPPQFRDAFLKNTVNKARFYDQLSEYLYHQCLTVEEGAEEKKFVLTKGRKVISTSEEIRMPDSTHIEADYRIILHVIHALKKSYSVITVRCNNSEIVILPIETLPASIIRSSSWRCVVRVQQH